MWTRRFESSKAFVLSLPAPVLYLPFLLFYVLIVCLSADNRLTGDEEHYHNYAIELWSNHTITLDNLWSGPGYALFLAPFVGLFGLQPFGLTMLNAPLLYAQLVVLHYTIRRLGLHKPLILLLVGAWGLYVPAFQTLRTLYSEPLVTLLWVMVACVSTKCSRNYLVLGLLLALMMLTKVIVAYAGLILLFITLLLTYALPEGVSQSPHYTRRWSNGLCVAYLLFVPYVLTTYQLTGRFPVLATAGGSSLYSMSSPYPGEYGSWIPTDFTLPDSYTQSAQTEYLATRTWHINHEATIAALAKTSSPLVRDSIFRARGFAQIASHPGSYLLNIVANASRMVFNYPFSYYRPHWLSLVYAAFNLPWLIAIAYIFITRGRQLSPKLYGLAGLVLFYLLCSVLLSAFPRQLYVVLPALLVLAISCYNHHATLQSTTPP